VAGTAGGTLSTRIERSNCGVIAGLEVLHSITHGANRAGHFMPEYLGNPDTMIHVPVKQMQIGSADSAV
jgi:hypothetical protein